MDEEWHAHLLENCMGLDRLFTRVARNADVKRLPLPYDVSQSSHRFCQWRIRIKPVGIKYVDKIPKPSRFRLWLQLAIKYFRLPKFP